MPTRSKTSVRARARRILVVDDDDLFRESIAGNLSESGFDVAAFPDGNRFLDFLGGGETGDIVLLDWKMPGMTGIQVLHRIRELGIDLPVIFLTHLNEQIYEERALGGGAVDFVEKTRSFAIILRRIELSLTARRAGGDGTQGALNDTGAPVRQGSLSLDPDSCRAFWNGQEVDLTLTEFEIVQRLIDRAGRDLPYRDLYDIVHGPDFAAGLGSEGYRANVRAFIKRIRQKFRNADDAFDCIVNYPGFGYRWVSDEAP
jgi:two-component system response regulator ChvI